MDTEQIKQMIKTELPPILRKDEEMRKWIIDLSRGYFADKKTTESRFDVLIEEMRKDREKQDRKWEKNQEELRKDREKQDRKWEKNQEEIRNLVAGIERLGHKYDATADAVKRLDRKHDSTIGALGARWGLSTEASFRNALKGILEDNFQIEVLNITEYDTAGEVFGRPDQVELDLIIKDGLLIIAEIKSSVSKSDMYTFHRKVKFYTKKHQREASQMIVISPMVDDRAKVVARELGIVVYSSADEVTL